MSKLMQIKHRYIEKVIYEAEASSMKELVEKAVSEKVNLYCADLTYADLSDADLTGTNLTYASFTGANLTGASLTRTNLYCANLKGANLTGADLYYANLHYANLSGADLTYVNLSSANLYCANLTDAITSKGKLIGERPYFKVGPIGSRRDEFILFVTDNGPFVKTGCFFGSFEEFEEKLKEEHDDNIHAEEYLAFLGAMKIYYKLWK